MDIVDVLPSEVDIKYSHLKIDGLFVSIITIVKYEVNIETINTMNVLLTDKETQITFHIRRENNFEVLKKLTSVIAESASEISSASKNQIDINVLDGIKQRASDLRRKIQIDNEQVYTLSTYIVVKAKTESELLNKQKMIINRLYSHQIVAKPSNFRQKEAYVATLPLMLNPPLLANNTHCVFTEHAIAKLFPFFEKDVFNKNGIIVGNANNNLCVIDIFSNKNNNYNMCIFGSSGAGKSYFVKLMIIKNAYKGIRQIIIDPEGEYVELVRKLGGHVYTFNTYNPFEIDESSTVNNNYFEDKIEYVEKYILNFVQDIDKQKLKDAIIQAYCEKGINQTKESLYKLTDEDKIYSKPKYINKFPTIKDLIRILKLNGIDINIIEEKYEENNNNLNSTEIFCFCLNSKSIESLQKEMKIFIPKIYELIRENTLIYFDEIWRGISLGQDSYVIEHIYNMFKTLRKKKAGIVAISQDICDLFSLDNGGFGKSILNNSNMKVLFKMEWQDIEVFQRMLPGEAISKKIKSLNRGNAYVNMNNTNFTLEVNATNFEHQLIEGEET